jgi:hypothetical protein
MGFGGYSANGGFDEGTTRRAELARRYPRKPKKTVFSTDQTIHVWAQQTQSYGSNAKASVFFEGPTLYSYGRHFVMARFATPDIVLINEDTFSTTTSGHIHRARYAVDHKTIFHVKYPEAADAATHQKNLDAFKKQALDFVDAAKNPRYAGHNRTAAARRAQRLVKIATDYQKAFFPRRRKAPFSIPDLTPHINAAEKSEALKNVRAARVRFTLAISLHMKQVCARQLLEAAHKARVLGVEITPPLNVVSILKTYFYARKCAAQLEGLGVVNGSCRQYAEHIQATAVGAYGGDFREIELFRAGTYRPRSYRALEHFISTQKTEAELLASEAEYEASRREYEARNAERRRLAAASDAEKIGAWRRGVYVPQFNGHAYPCMLRVDGADIVTSWGAEFPAEHARKAWPLIRAVYQSGKAWKTNGHKIPLGLFKVDSIDENGTLRAGCHTLTKAEVENCARLLGLTVA